MKKTFLILLACTLITTPAFARGGHHLAPKPHPKPHHSSHHSGAGLVLGTIAGITLFDAIASANKTEVVQLNAPKVYIAEPEQKCYTVVSRKKGSVERKCVNSTENEIIYVD